MKHLVIAKKFTEKSWNFKKWNSQFLSDVRRGQTSFTSSLYCKNTLTSTVKKSQCKMIQIKRKRRQIFLELPVISLLFYIEIFITKKFLFFSWVHPRVFTTNFDQHRARSNFIFSAWKKDPWDIKIATNHQFSYE